MNDRLQIVIGIKEINEKKMINELLLKNGYNVTGEATEGVGFMKLINNLQPELAILDSRLLGQDLLDGDIIRAADLVTPIIILAPNSNKHLLQKVKEGLVFGLLIKPVENEQLVAGIELAVTVHAKILDLEKQVEKANLQLKVRKLLERAKGIIMEEKGFNEEQAFNWLRKQSMDRRRPVEAVAEAIILSRQMKTN